MKKTYIAVAMAAALCACEKNPDAPAKVSAEQKAQIEKCIDVICDKVFIDGDDGGLVVMDSESSETSAILYQYKIPQDSALKISKNWDYKAPKYYQNNADGILYNYEIDACDVVKKLDRFVVAKRAEFLLKASCEKIITGERGDYVMKCDSPIRFKHILEREKTTKFLSAGKDHITEYLADKDSIYVNVIEKEKCFRVMAPNSDINGWYAVEGCE